MLEDAIEQAKLLDEIEKLRKSNIALQAKLIRAKGKVDDLVDATREAAYNAVVDLGGIGEIPAPVKDTRKAREAVCLWHLTDWQGGKKTSTYNSEIMRERVDEFVVKATKLVMDARKARPVKNCVIVFGGDMLENAYANFPTQAHEIDASIFQQYVTVADQIVKTVQKALALFEKVEVVAEWGNHGRISWNVPRADNFDRMIYELARQLLQNEKRLTWADSPNDWQPIVIGQFVGVAIHGDEFGRNGYSSATNLVNSLMKWQSGSLGFSFNHAYVGHYHTSATWSLPAGGLVFQTGSTESDNRYAQIQLASMVRPSQRMQLIDPEKGRVISDHIVWLGE